MDEQQPEVAKALTKLLLSASNSPELARYRAKGKCEQYSDALRAKTSELLGGKDLKFPFAINFHAPIFSWATRALRGRPVNQLGKNDFIKLPPGTVLFANSPSKYGESIVPFTDDALPKIDDASHWFTYLGQAENGELLFADNHGDSVDFQRMKITCGKRVIINVYDPYAGIRDKMALSSGGQLVLKASGGQRIASL